MFISPKLAVRATEKGKGLFAIDTIDREEVLITFEGKILDHPTKTTLQIEEGQHLEGPGEHDDYLNHSCNPNTYIDCTRRCLCALCSIPPGAEITFNYLTTEWDMANKFTCQCGDTECVKEIKGFKYLMQEQREGLSPFLSPFLQKKYKE